MSPNEFNKNCNLVIVENFPSNVYIDKYELAGDMYSQNYKFLIKTNSSVDVEKAEFESESFDLYLYLNPAKDILCDKNEISKSSSLKISEDNVCYLNLKLPFHLRYHKNLNESLVKFHLNDPKILANCVATNLNKNTVQLPCDTENNSSGCSWNELFFTKVIISVNLL